MVTKEKIISARQEYMFDTLQQIADKFDVTAPYIHQVLKANNISTSRVRFTSTKNKIQCTMCEKWGKRKVCLGDCYRQYYFFYVRCNNCWSEWHMRRAQMKQKGLRGDKNIYCSRECYFEAKAKRSY